MAFAISSGVPMRLFGDLRIEKICLVFLRLRKAVKHSRFHRARANDVDTDARAGEFEGRGLRDAIHGVLAANIDGRARAADFAISGRDVHDAAPRLAAA